MSVNLKGYKDLDVYQLSYRMAVEIFEETKNFPKEEKFSLYVECYFTLLNKVVEFLNCNPC